MSDDRRVTLFLAGDVMTGRGIDQVLPSAGDPTLYEPVADDARSYVRLAERAHGPVGAPVAFGYPWGDALAELARAAPALRIVNLETAVTASGDAWPGKGIHYRMHPGNVACLQAAHLDCVCLANNHVLDWGYAGLAETVATVRGAGIATAGAGADLAAAAAPAVLPLPGGGRLLLFAAAWADSGIPEEWRAAPARAGIHLLPDAPEAAIAALSPRIAAVRRPGDLVVASVHWGENWGHELPRRQRRLAHLLVEQAGVDVVHGHSAHHVKAVEVHRGRLVLYGCGDLLTDYEGIGGYEGFRGDLGALWLPTLERASGALVALRLVPTTMRRLQLRRASVADADWLAATLGVTGGELGTRFDRTAGGWLELRWRGTAAAARVSG